MNTFHENDVVRLREEVKANIIAGAEILIPAGSEGTVVLVHGSSEEPSAYEVEFYIPGQNDFAIATVDSRLVSTV